MSSSIPYEFSFVESGSEPRQLRPSDIYGPAKRVRRYLQKRGMRPVSFRVPRDEEMYLEFSGNLDRLYLRTYYAQWASGPGGPRLIVRPLRGREE